MQGSLGLKNPLKVCEHRETFQEDVEKFEIQNSIFFVYELETLILTDRSDNFF